MLNYENELYDETSPESIEKYGKKLIGQTFKDVQQSHNVYISDNTENNKYYILKDNKKHKGNLGDLIEECFFNYSSNNKQLPDFDKAGVELKVTPYKINKNKSISAKERLVITMIDYFEVVNETFEESHLWQKARLILLIYYLYEPQINDRLDYRIKYVKLFTPSKEDIKIIKDDFVKIVEKIRNGKAHELSEGDTMYLGACPKAAKASDRRKQPFSNIDAKPRAFSFKSSYMTYVLNNYIIGDCKKYESIITNEIEETFEEYVVKKIMEYKNYTEEELCKIFKISFTKKPKNLGAIIAYRILGIKGNYAEEFVKANIVVKTIRLGKNNNIKESMSFPTFKFKELINEEWETSTFRTYLSETRFLFIIYKYDENDNLYLKGCQFWNISYNDLETDVKSVWLKTKDTIDKGLIIRNINNKMCSNFPKISENPVCHVRPHSQNSNDTYELPDGRLYPKQCFWLNSKYILSQLNKEFL